MDKTLSFFSGLTPRVNNTPPQTHKPYWNLGFGAVDVNKPHRIVGFGTMVVTNLVNLYGLFVGGGFCSRGGIQHS